MRPLDIVVVRRDRNGPLLGRNAGWWSYEVPEFIVRDYPVQKWFWLSRDKLAKRHDIIHYEDAKAWGTFPGTAGVPVCYHVVDSTLSVDHYIWRRNKAKEVANLVLLDWDRADRWEDLGVPVRRLAYCVNDKRFYDRGLERALDVTMMCGMRQVPMRSVLRESLREVCERRGWRCRLQGAARDEYAELFNRGRVTVNWNCNPQTRSHRVMDAMAARTCLVSDPLPAVDGERFVDGVHYAACDDPLRIEEVIADLLETGRWQEIADAGHDYVMREHTWAVRAGQLYDTFCQVFP